MVNLKDKRSRGDLQGRDIIIGVHFKDVSVCQLQDEGGDDRSAVQEADRHAARGWRWVSGREGGGRPRW